MTVKPEERERERKRETKEKGTWACDFVSYFECLETEHKAEWQLACIMTVI